MPRKRNTAEHIITKLRQAGLPPQLRFLRRRQTRITSLHIWPCKYDAAVALHWNGQINRADRCQAKEQTEQRGWELHRQVPGRAVGRVRSVSVVGATPTRPDPCGGSVPTRGASRVEHRRRRSLLAATSLRRAARLPSPDHRPSHKIVEALLPSRERHNEAPHEERQ